VIKPAKNPRISVLMTAYNDAAFAKESIESILSQTFDDFEFIVVDDGSTDSTGPLLHTLSDKRLKIILTTHIGRPKALNLALAEARGEYIALQDADDIAHPERLRRQVDFLESHRSIGYLGTGLTIINEKGGRIRDYAYPSDPAEIRRLLDGMFNPLPQPSLLLRAEVLASSGGYDPFFRNSEDYDLHLRLTERHSASCLPEPLLKYRLRMNSLSHDDAPDSATRYSMFARMLAGIRRGEVPRPPNSDKEELYREFSLWFDKERLSEIYHASQNRRRAMVEFSLGHIIRPAYYAGLSAIQDPHGAWGFLTGRRVLRWNRERERSLCEFLTEKPQMKRPI